MNLRLPATGRGSWQSDMKVTWVRMPFLIKVQRKTDELLAWVKATDKNPVATPQLARYNPPWTLPFMRRNEIVVEVSSP